MSAPVFVMNPYYSGLGIARSLHGHGVRVYALSSERDAPGVRSRYFDGVYHVPNGRDEPERLRDRLLEIRHEYADRPVVFPTRDFDVLLLNEYRDALAAAYVLPQPADSPILRMMDKLELARIAGERGITAPATVVCSSAADLERAVMALRFPIVVKPRFAYQWRRKGLWEKVGAAKAIIISSADELRREYLRVSEVTPEILLQEYVAGDDCDIVVCCCYINRRSELLGYFTGRKLKQSPPYVGTGSIVEATEVSAILTPAVELLSSFGYAGLAEVEFKYDKSADRYALIEVNPRHWDQHELGMLVGVNMSWIAYSDLVGGSIAPVKPVYAPGRQYKWIAERELIDAVVRSLRSEVKTTRASRGWLRGSYAALKKVLPDVLRLLRGSKMFGILRIGDPLPAMQLGLALVAAAWGLLIAAGRPSKLRYRARAIGEGDRRL